MMNTGGEDFDQRVMEHFIKLYKKKKGKDLRKDNRAVQKLRREVEKAKRAQLCHLLIKLGSKLNPCSKAKTLPRP